MRNRIITLFLLLPMLLSGVQLTAATIDREWVEHNYTKREVMIAMRDGVRLYTAIYEPLHATAPSPVLYTRTPYSASPYGERMSSGLWNAWKKRTSKATAT